MIVYNSKTGKSKSVVNWKAIKFIWVFFLIVVIIPSLFPEASKKIAMFFLNIIACILGLELQYE